MLDTTSRTLKKANGSSSVIHANDVDFDMLLDNGRVNIVDFWSPNCIPCKKIEPILEDIASKYSNQVKVIKVNVNDSPRLTSRFYVMALPTLLIIVDGRVEVQVNGAVNDVIILGTVQKLIKMKGA